MPITLYDGTGNQDTARSRIWIQSNSGVYFTAGTVLSIDHQGFANPAIATSNTTYYDPRVVAAQERDFTIERVLANLTGTFTILFEIPISSNNLGSKVYLSSTMAGTVTITPPFAAQSVVVEVGKLMGTDGVNNAGVVEFNPRVISFN